MKTFKGGVHPPDQKAYTNGRPIEEMPAPEYLYLPMRQHLGAVCAPVVQKGDHVLLGQVIGRSNAAISADVHACVSGIVTDILPYDHPSGTQVETVVIQNDGKDTPDPSIKAHNKNAALTPEEIVQAVKKAGIVGMGGAGFPTHIKLNVPSGKTVKTVIINGAECEPYLTSDHCAILENAEDIIQGLRLAMQATGAQRGVVAIEKNKQNAIDLLAKKTVQEPNIEVVALPTKYPQGSEKQLIYALIGREVPAGKLPIDVNVVVLNIDTVSAVARAVYTGMPLISRIVTVSGGAIKEPKNLKVRIGTRICDLFSHCGCMQAEMHKLLVGGPMMGLAQFTDTVPIIKTSSAVLALSKQEAQLEPESPCIKCGKCVEVCPMGLVPVYMNLYTLTNQLEKVRKLAVFECIECGCCSYICPAKRYLVQSFKIAKQNILEESRRKQELARKQ